jgi:hypothetical protein
MDWLKRWWNNELSKWVKVAFLALAANGIPAFLILMTVPGMTERLFVWTVKPEINARLMGVMYGNALLLVGLGILQTKWARVRIIMVLITVFSILATILTFVYLKPFLAHPWFHLAFWLTMYFILFFVSPYVLVTHEQRYGGRLLVQVPLKTAGRLTAIVLLILCVIGGLGLLFRVDVVNQFWPWKLPPLVGGLIGVLFTSHAAAYAWALWDRDWLRVRPIFLQAPLTGLLFILLPLIHPGDLRPDAGPALALYYLLAALATISTLGVILGQRGSARKRASHAQ